MIEEHHRLMMHATADLLRWNSEDIKSADIELEKIKQLMNSAEGQSFCVEDMGHWAGKADNLDDVVLESGLTDKIRMFLDLGHATRFQHFARFEGVDGPEGDGPKIKQYGGYCCDHDASLGKG